MHGIKTLFDRLTDSGALLGKLKESHQLSPTSLEKEEIKLEGDEKREFLRFIGRMLEWDPNERPSAKELAEDPWPQSGLSDGEDTDIEPEQDS